MKLFSDEDTGSSLGRALRTLGFQDIDWVGLRHPIEPGTPDRDWYPYIATHDLMVLSRNVRMLDVEAEIHLIRTLQLRLIFLPQHASPIEMMRVVMARWDWLAKIYGEEPRPFAFRISKRNRVTRLRIPELNDDTVGE